MTALRAWAAIGAVAFLIMWGWYAAERVMAVAERRRDERRFRAQRLNGERP